MKLIPIVLASAAVALAGPAVASASDTTPVPVASAAKTHMKKRAAHRRGGHVRAAWPRSKSARKPRNRIARWLAKQVGPVNAVRKRHKKGKHAVASAASTTTPLWL